MTTTALRFPPCPLVTAPSSVWERARRRSMVTSPLKGLPLSRFMECSRGSAWANHARMGCKGHAALGAMFLSRRWSASGLTETPRPEERERAFAGSAPWSPTCSFRRGRSVRPFLVSPDTDRPARESSPRWRVDRRDRIRRAGGRAQDAAARFVHLRASHPGGAHAGLVRTRTPARAIEPRA